MRRPELRRGWTTVRLFSGLGNQLFQYAAGRAVAEQTGTKLRFDVSYFGLEPHRSYALGDFRIRAKLDLSEHKSAEFMADPAAEAAYAAERFGAEVLRQNGSDFDASILANAPARSFICGYWQSEGYFKSVEGLVRGEVRPRETPAIQAGRQTIGAAACSVAVHVRRGDLVDDPRMGARFGVLGADYYRRAARFLLERNTDAEFFVFSDDPDWCRAELDLPAPTRVISGENAPFEDLALISACDHAVIANSSFSWWGAWLGEREGSLIVAPQDAFTGEKAEPAGYYPSRWIRV